MEDRIESGLLMIVRTAEGGGLSHLEASRLKWELDRISQSGGVLICPPGVSVYRRVGDQWEPLPDRGPEFGAHVVSGQIRDFACKPFTIQEPSE